MMKKLADISIRARLRLISFLTALVFALVVVTLVVAFRQVQSGLETVTQVQFNQLLENSQLSRDLAQFISGKQLVVSSFYGKDELLQREGQRLQAELKRLVPLSQGELQPKLLALQGQFDSFLEQCQVVNWLLLQRRILDEEINSVLLLVEEILAERMIEVALHGEDTGYLEQLVLLVSGYRESLLEIARDNASEDHQIRLSGRFDDPPPLDGALLNLSLRLRTLSASEPPVDRFGRHLTGQLDYYRFLMTRYQQEMIHLGERQQSLEESTQQVLAALSAFETRSSSVVQNLDDAIDRHLFLASLVVFGLLIALFSVLTVAHFGILRKHIEHPLALLSQRLQRFRAGDYSSPLPLGRRDEWGQIEGTFNEMLSDLVKSWSALQESERRYRDIFANASEGIFQSTLQGEYLNLNPALAKILGFDSPQQAMNELTSLREQIYVDPADRDRLVARIREQGFAQGFEVRLRRRSGEPFWASVNGHLVRDEDGEVAFLEGTTTDISQRRQAEDSLRQLQGYLQNIIDSMPSVLIGVDADSRVTLWNRQAALRSGVDAGKAVGAPIVEVFNAIDAYQYLPSLRDALLSRVPGRLHKVPGVAEGGCYFDILIYPLQVGDSRGCVLHIEEVTERVQIEEMMVQSEKMLSVGGLAAGMAHEINNPLAAILQNVQVLDQRFSPALNKNREVAEELGLSIEQIADYMEKRGIGQVVQSISSAGNRAAKIVQNMLTFSRKSSSQFITRNLADLVERTLELAASDFDMKQHYDFRSIRIVRDFSPVPDVPCEPGQIQQVILNLLKNAAQALSGGSAEAEISLRIFQQGSNVCLQVCDNGPGMSDEVRKRVFEPFFTTREPGKGTGLGLSVSYFIVVENHKGSLSVSSEPGEGACFTLSLPQRAPARKTTGS